MRSEQRKPVCLGDVIAAAFDAANGVSDDERTTSMLAACAVRRFLVKTGRIDLARRLTE